MPPGRPIVSDCQTIYMAVWEETVWQKSAKLPTCYFRYLDDIWGVWDHTEEDIFEFVNTLNGHHESIKIKWELKTNKINFLDTTVFKDQSLRKRGGWTQRYFFKPTDTHASPFLLPSYMFTTL